MKKKTQTKPQAEEDYQSDGNGCAVAAAFIITAIMLLMIITTIRTLIQ